MSKGLEDMLAYQLHWVIESDHHYSEACVGVLVFGFRTRCLDGGVVHTAAQIATRRRWRQYSTYENNNKDDTDMIGNTGNDGHET